MNARRLTPGTRASALLLGWVWLAACTHDALDERSGGGASGLGSTADETAATVSTHVAPATPSAPSHGTDPDSSAPVQARDAGTPSRPGHEDAATSTGSPASETGAPEAAPPSLRSAEPGAAPLFDPGAVYMLGTSTEVDGVDPQAVAPVVDLSDSVLGISWFSHEWIRNDGRLLYQDNNYADPVREFLRDPAPGTGDRHDGETEYTSSLPCNPLEAAQSTQRRYLMGWDGSLYHTCGDSDVVAPPNDADLMAWYDAAGNLMYRGDIWTARVGAQGRALGQRDQTLIVFEFASGAEIGSLDLGAQATIAARMHENGFWVALRDPDTGARSWLDIDLSGALSARGDYAPLPEGVSYAAGSNPFTDGGMAVIDGLGRLYEFATLAGEGDAGSDLVVVRRPQGEGTSDVPYRASAYDPDAPHDIFVMEPILFTGG